MQKISTMQTSGNKIFKGQLTVGLDLGDRSSSYCVLDEAGEVVLEQMVLSLSSNLKSAKSL
jgi:transposase